MPNFSKLFEEANWKPINYKGEIVTRIDKFPISDGDTLIISIEKTNSENVQGVSVDITGKCKFGREIFEKGKGVNMRFWEDAAGYDPKHIELTIFTKKDFVWVQNIWEITNHLGKKSVDSGHHGAAMIVEEIENGRRYRCNDWHPDENFDDIVFTVTKLK